MQRRILGILVIFLSWFPRFVQAQERELDSLYRLALGSGAFNEKCRATHQLLTTLRETTRDSARYRAVYHLLDQLEGTARMRSDKKNLAAIHLDKAWYFHDQLGLDSSIIYSLSAEKYYRAAKDTAKLKICYYNLWSAHRRLNHFNTALGYFFRCKEIQEQQRDTAGILDSYYNLGLMYMSKEIEPQKAIEAFTKSLQFGIRPDDGNYVAMAEAWLLLHKPDSAAKYLELCKARAQSKVIYERPYYYRAKAKYLKYIGRYDSAIHYFNKAIEWLSIARQNHNQSKCYYQVGEIYFNQKNYRMAEASYKKAKEIASRFCILNSHPFTWL